MTESRFRRALSKQQMSSDPNNSFDYIAEMVRTSLLYSSLDEQILLNKIINILKTNNPYIDIGGKVITTETYNHKPNSKQKTVWKLQKKTYFNY